MERVKRLISQIGYTQTPNLSLLHFSLIPFLSFASSLYYLSLSLRRRLYLSGLFPKQRLPVPVISVGNLTWGGNGKTPMVEFIALLFHSWGISPLVLTRGYAGGDEVRMLHGHLAGTSVKIGVGADRAAIAASFFQKYGHVNQQSKHCSNSDKVGIVILDDGMQHWSLFRDLEIVMVNGMAPWGNKQLLPRGPLREPLSAICRADIAVIHHTDLVSDKQLKAIQSTLRSIKETLPILFSRLSPSHFFQVKDKHSKLPLIVIQHKVVLCVSAIGFPNAFVEVIGKIGPLYVDRLDFTDHHFIQAEEIAMIKERLTKLNVGFDVKPIVVVTEKDYYRDPHTLKELDGFEILILCSSLELIPLEGQTEESFINLLKYNLLKDS